MKKTTGEKKIGFYLVMAAAVLSLVSMLIYRTVLSQLGMVYGLSVIPAIVGISRNENDWRKRTSQLGWTC